MIRHKLYIDGEDIAADYGCVITSGTLAKMLEIPQFKTLPMTDWHEHDGVEIDLSSPVFKPLEFSLSLAGTGARTLSDAFMTREYHFLEVLETFINWEMVRFRACAEYSRHGNLETLRLNAATDDDYTSLLSGYETYYGTPGTTVEPFGFGDITAGNWGKYGIRVLDGWVSEIGRPADVKEPLKRDISTLGAVIYDSPSQYNTTTFKQRELKLTCLLNSGSSVTDFWDRYLSFMYKVTMPGAITLKDSNNSATQCYYGGMAVTEYIPSQPVPWLKFTLTLKTI